MQQHNTERLQRHISTYSLLAILLVGGIISAVGIWFYANALKQNQQFDLQRELHLRQHAVRRGLERMRDIAIQISSRSRARQVLEGYNNNRVSLDELVSVSRPILADAMRNTADVAGILRLDVGGKQAVNIGTKISDDARALAVVHTKQAEILDIKILNDRFYLRVISPIRNRSGQRVGTDVVLFKTRQLFLSLSEHDGSRFAVTTVLGERRAEGVRWLFSSAAGSAKEENLDEPALEAIIISASSGQSGFSSSSGDSQKVRAYGPIQGLPWGLSVAMGKRDLYAPVWRDSTILGLVLVALLLLGGLLLLLVQRPFARRVIDQAKALDWEIEERRRAERDLAEKTRLLEATLENIDQGISAVDANLIVVAFNKRFLELLDLPAERFQPGTPFADVIRYNADRGEYGAGDPEQLTRQRVELARAFEPHRFERTMGNGTVLEIVGNRMPGGGFVTTYTDISGHKRAEQALRNSEQRFRALYDDNPSMFFTMNACGQILSVNRFGANQLGYTVEQLLGMSVLDLSPQQDTVRIKTQLENCLKAPDEVNRWETLKIRKDGSHLWVREVTRVVIDADNRIRIMVVCEDITEARELSAQLSFQATHDALTGLDNRRAFEQRLQELLKVALPDTEHAICYLDLDQFKIINDTCGHVAGDELLRQLGSVLPRHTRRNDMLARLGGDEFGVLLENCSLKQALRVTEELRKSIQEFRFSWEDKSFSIGASIGLVPVTGTDLTLSEILAAADTACYAAKDGGRNRVHVYHEADETLVTRRGEMQWLTRTRQALNENRFRLYCQMIEPVAAATPGLRYEVLVRMLDEQGAVVLPGVFLPAAERYNLMPSVDRWVVGETLRQLGEHPDHLRQLSECAINLSGLSITEDNFAQFVVDTLHSHAVPAEKICFEITETAAISNLASARRFITTLEELGCKFSLDDFGSGLSSFAYLKTLPVHYLKIDGLFIKDILDDPLDLALVRSINEIGHVMGKKMIAEFVESKQIHDTLVKMGVDFLQGYYIARPQPLENLLLNNPHNAVEDCGVYLVQTT